MTARCLVVAILALSSSLAAAGEVVARIGPTEVTSEEVRSYVATLGDEERAALEKDPALLPQLVRTYVVRKAVLREAASKRYDQTPAVKAQLDRLRDQALAELYLQSISQPPREYPSDAQVEAAYEANRAAFALPKQYRVAQIFVSAEKRTADEARRRAEELAKRARAKGADFAATARADTDEKGAGARGGELGWLAEEQMVPGIRATVAALAKDGVSDPIKLEDGWHVVKLLDLRPPSTRPLPEVRDAIAAQLRAERAKAGRQAYLARLLEDAPPAINELALSKLVAPARSPATATP
jgi:peptidylprolyl isomerase